MGFLPLKFFDFCRSELYSWHDLPIYTDEIIHSYVVPTWESQERYIKEF